MVQHVDEQLFQATQKWDVSIHWSYYNLHTSYEVQQLPVPLAASGSGHKAPEGSDPHPPDMFTGGMNMAFFTPFSSFIFNAHTPYPSSITLSYHQPMFLTTYFILLTLFQRTKTHCIQSQNVADRHIITTMGNLLQTKTKPQALSNCPARLPDQPLPGLDSLT